MRSALQRITDRRVIEASVTPLASIFGSGFLIIIPILERTLGALAIAGVVAVCALAWLVGSAVRHNVAVAEPSRDAGELDRRTVRLEKLGDLIIVVAYVISVALYLRIMAEYMVGLVDEGGSDIAERTVASAAVALIVIVGVSRGFSGLDLMERIALGAVLVLTTVLGGAFFITDGADLFSGSLELPPVADTGFTDVLLILGGIVITVQGFETVRYLGEEYDYDTRIWASRLAQLLAASIYIGFVLVATPLMGLGTPAGLDSDLLDLTRRVLPLFLVPLVICAMLSQFSAATADTVAAAGNMRLLGGRIGHGPWPYLISGTAAIALCWTVPTLTIVAIASRAFAAYYCVECLIALATTDRTLKRVGFGALAVVLLAITLLAKPAG